MSDDLREPNSTSFLGESVIDKFQVYRKTITLTFLAILSQYITLIHAAKPYIVAHLITHSPLRLVTHSINNILLYILTHSSLHSAIFCCNCNTLCYNCIAPFYQASYNKACITAYIFSVIVRVQDVKSEWVWHCKIVYSNCKVVR